MKRLTIAVNNIEDRNALMGVMYAYGAVFHATVAPGQYTLQKANNSFVDMLYLRLERIDKDLDICALSVGIADANFSEDPSAALTLIKDYTKPEVARSVTVNNVGDYNARVKPDGIHIYGQVISFEKFDEIAAAFTKLNS